MKNKTKTDFPPNIIQPCNFFLFNLAIITSLRKKKLKID